MNPLSGEDIGPEENGLHVGATTHLAGGEGGDVVNLGQLLVAMDDLWP